MMKEGAMNEDDFIEEAVVMKWVWSFNDYLTGKTMFFSLQEISA